MKNPLLQQLQHHFGFSQFRQGQEEIITAIMRGEQVLAILPTGGGKSLCYQLPALLAPGVSVVISPLIALMKDQVDALNRTVTRAAAINSSVEWFEIDRIMQEASYGNIKLLYCAPERLDNKQFLQQLYALRPEYVFIDEAHCISEWGHSFRPAYRKITEAIKTLGVKKTAAFTATATPEVARDIVQQLEMKNPQVFIRGFERTNLFLRAENASSKKDRVRELVLKTAGSGIIYTASRKKAEEVSEYLRLNGVKCDYYHAGLSAPRRKQIQDQFLSGKLPVIAATTAFGMGIDKTDIRFVLHYNLPASIENYYQEIGRAGRDGKESLAVLLYDKSDVELQEFLLSNSYPTKDVVTGVYNALALYANLKPGDYSGKEVSVNYDYITAFLKKDITRAHIASSLRFLEEENYLHIVAEEEKKPAVEFLYSPERLKQFIQTGGMNAKKEIIITLIRLYGNQIFEKKTLVSLWDISSASTFHTTAIETIFTELHQQGIIAYTRPLSGETIVFLQPIVPAGRLQLNTKRINEAYLIARKKLEQMEDFVFTDICRSAYILNYFGEKNDNHKCGKCDRCIKETGIVDNTIEYIREVVLRALYGNDGNFSDTQLIALLRGTTKVKEAATNPAMGTCANYTREELMMIIGHLLAEGYIKRDPVKMKKLLVGNKGLTELRKLGYTMADIADGNYEEVIELYHLLREARAHAAQKFGQSKEVLCPDDILREIAVRKPETKGQMLSIPGFNERMFNKIGEQILSVLTEYARSGTAAGKTVATLNDTVGVTRRMMMEGKTLQEISEIRKMLPAVVSMQVETILSIEPDADVDKLIPGEVYEKIAAVITAGITDMKEIKKRVPETIGYPEIRIVLAKRKYFV